MNLQRKNKIWWISVKSGADKLLKTTVYDGNWKEQIMSWREEFYKLNSFFNGLILKHFQKPSF